MLVSLQYASPLLRPKKAPVLDARILIANEKIVRIMLAQLNRTLRLVACTRRASTGATTQEWKAAGLGAQWAPPDTALTEIVFVQAGMGCDQHGISGASKAATRACRQAIEFNALRRA